MIYTNRVTLLAYVVCTTIVINVVGGIFVYETSIRPFLEGVHPAAVTAKTERPPAPDTFDEAAENRVDVLLDYMTGSSFLLSFEPVRFPDEINPENTFVRH